MYHNPYDPSPVGSSSSTPKYHNPYNYDHNDPEIQPSAHPHSQSHTHSGYPDTVPRHDEYNSSATHPAYNNVNDTHHSGNNAHATHGAQGNSAYSQSDYPTNQYWSYHSDPSSSRLPEHGYHSQDTNSGINRGDDPWGPIPSPGIVPPLPNYIEQALTDNALLNLQHWGPFSSLDTSGPARDTALGSQPFDLNTFINGHLQFSAPFDANGQNGSLGTGAKGFGYDAVSHLMSSRHDSATIATPGSDHSQFNLSHVPTSANIFRDAGYEGRIGRKGKEKADGMGDTPEETKPLRGEGHNEFDKDIALVRLFCILALVTHTLRWSRS